MCTLLQTCTLSFLGDKGKVEESQAMMIEVEELKNRLKEAIVRIHTCSQYVCVYISEQLYLFTLVVYVTFYYILWYIVQWVQGPL